MLVLDAGNALFQSALAGDVPQQRARALFLLEQMDALGTRAMAVGSRDLTLGPALLTQALRGHTLQALSANLVDARGKPLFPASTVVTVGGVRVGLVGVSPGGPVSSARGVQGLPPVPAALAEARRLRGKEKVDVVVVLAALPMEEFQALSRQVGPDADFLLQSGQGRMMVPEREGSAVLLGAGERGRQVARLELSMDGSGPFVDLSVAERAQRSLKILEENIQQGQQSLAAARDETVRASWRETLASLEARKQEVAREAFPEGRKASERTFTFTYLTLGSDVADDPALKTLVERIEPPRSASH